MSVETEDLRQAMDDLRMIRRAVELTSGESAKTSKRAVSPIIFLHVALLAAVLVLFFGEAASGATTGALLASATDVQLRTLGLLNLFWLTICFAVLFYAIAWFGARAEDEDFTVYLAKNFSYLKNLSQLSDLAVKFSAIALVIVAAHPQFVAPLLTLFLGDYLFSGRLFVLPPKLAIISGAVCFCAAIAQFICRSPSAIYPLGFAAALLCVSLLQLTAKYKRAETPAAE